MQVKGAMYTCREHHGHGIKSRTKSQHLLTLILQREGRSPCKTDCEVPLGLPSDASSSPPPPPPPMSQRRHHDPSGRETPEGRALSLSDVLSIVFIINAKSLLKGYSFNDNFSPPNIFISPYKSLARRIKKRKGIHFQET